MRIYAFITLCIVLLSMAEFAGRYPQNEFVSPVNRPMKLSGTFGELRTNHFHAGLDIRSLNQTIGDPIYAASEGHISRIKVNAFGYGNTLYIDHPNGFTSLYAHLDRFTPEIENYVKEQQYMLKSFEVDLYPGDRFPVAQLQHVAYMGNTGHSYGPHLHFEIRHTHGQVPVNPLHFGYDIPDKVSPVIQNLVIYEYDELGQQLNTRLYQPKWKSSGVYTLPQTVQIEAAKVSFGIRSYDTQDGSTNQNGIYSINCKADDEPSFAFSLDEIPIDQTRYMNAHIDYKLKINENLFTHRCYALEGNKLPIYYTGSDQGRFEINREHARLFTFSIADFEGNISQLTFEVIKGPGLAPIAMPPQKFQAMGNPDEITILNQPGIQVAWPEDSFYEKIPLNVTTTPKINGESYSPYFELSPLDIPVHTYFDISIDGVNVPVDKQNKAFIARCEPNGSIINCGGTWIGNNLSTGVRQMSMYTIMVDTIAPKVTPVSFGLVMTNWQKMTFRISDNFRVRDKGRDLFFEGYVDGEWILLELDGKSGLLSHHFDGRIKAGVHSLLIKVTDDRGNVGVLEKTFTL
ncbi:MAG: M23 family metallopeptidase [Saprospiraceae bacterium]